MAEYLVFIRCLVLGDWWSSDPTNWQRRQHWADRRWPPASDAGISVFVRFLLYVFVMKDPAYLSHFCFLYLWWRIEHICQISALCICDERSSVFVRFFLCNCDEGFSIFVSFLLYVFVMKDPVYLSDFYFMYLWWRIQSICQISTNM